MTSLWFPFSSAARSGNNTTSTTGGEVLLFHVPALAEDAVIAVTGFLVPAEVPTTFAVHTRCRTGASSQLTIASFKLGAGACDPALLAPSGLPTGVPTTGAVEHPSPPRIARP